MGFCSDGPVNLPAKFEIRSFAHSWDNSDCNFGREFRTSNLGKGGV